MLPANSIRRLKHLHRRLNGSTLEDDLSPYFSDLHEIKQIRSGLKKIPDQGLKGLSKQMAGEVKKGRPTDDLLVEAYALVLEAVIRVLSLHPFDSQLIGAMVLHQGKIAEMQTGEGKTLTAVFPAYLNALAGKGVHILTFNDYLARRDVQWMGAVYRFLGITTGCVQEGMDAENRKNAYLADITYLTANEAGFDYLRDSQVHHCDACVQRAFNFALVDEADSILIDEARIPLIIAGACDRDMEKAVRLAEVVAELVPGLDFDSDEYARNVHLNEPGIRRIEALLHCGNLYDPENIEVLTHIHCAIHAEFLFSRDIDYIVRNNKIELIDEFTGRVVDKRRWPDGLQAALEAKERVPPQSRGQILNTLTIQHYLANYPKISGMTATARAAEEEAKRFYNLDIVVIPPHKPCVRKDYRDRVFHTHAAKHKAVIQEILRVHRTRRPILVGTSSVAESESLAAALRAEGVACQVLNAKNDGYEAGIVAVAGKLDAVTISTNMAGRGTDIRLGGIDEAEKKRVARLGGLYVIGTNRYESNRIDAQLRGRAGRQGDPGSSCFFISLEDDLFTRYGLAGLLSGRSYPTNLNGEIESKIVNREIDRIQRIISGQNLEIKKTLVKYSLLVERQRQTISHRREKILSPESADNFFQSNCSTQYNRLLDVWGQTRLHMICRSISLLHLDQTWSQYLEHMADIREGIHLVRLGQQNPLHVYQKIAISVFNELCEKMEAALITQFNRIDIHDRNYDAAGSGFKAPSSTWTYLINDDPFEKNIGIALAGNIGLSLAAGVAGPILFLFHWVKSIRHRNKSSLISDQGKCARKRT